MTSTFLLFGPQSTRKGVVGMDVLPTTIPRTANEEWLKRTQESLARRSADGHTFNRLYDLLRDKRLVRFALNNVLENGGAKTPGIDGVTKDDLKLAEEREEYAHQIWRQLRKKTYRPSPVRRVYIPKPNGEMRPLGIPTIKDRVVQEMLRLILEPIYESKFYRLSFGFRPFRSTHHAAVELHWLIARHNYNYFVEGDIRKCFDRIHHEGLLSILRRVIKDESLIRVIRQMLKAGVMEDEAWRISDEGTPQGGIVSPLLANIYLNELDWYIASKWDLLTRNQRDTLKRHGMDCPMYIVRYADDFVIAIRGTKDKAEAIKQDVKEFLQRELALELSETKTLVTAASEGFDFLGFNIRLYREVALIKPSRKAVERFKATVKERIRTGFGNGDQAGIIYLNRYLLGWGAYYRRVSSSGVFHSLDHFVWGAVWRWTARLHMKSARQGNMKAHYAAHAIPYRFDLHKANRWHRSKHYGAWVDQKHTAAYIVTHLYFNHIAYVSRHPQLHPYLPGQREQLARRMKQLRLPASHEPDLPQYGVYGAEWRDVRAESLERVGYKCMQCGAFLKGRQATVHHVRKLNSFRRRTTAHQLENLLPACPKCHAALETQGNQGGRSS